MAWPEYFPADCPPDDATDAVGNFYRFAESDPVTGKDCICLWIRQNGNIQGANKCGACGLSVFTDLKDADRLRKIFKTYRKKHLAAASLATPTGKIKSTPTSAIKSHHTWWVPIGVQAETLLIVVKEHK
jgi:hypothetical protein